MPELLPLSLLNFKCFSLTFFDPMLASHFSSAIFLFVLVEKCSAVEHRAHGHRDVASDIASFSPMIFCQLHDRFSSAKVHYIERASFDLGLKDLQ